MKTNLLSLLGLILLLVSCSKKESDENVPELSNGLFCLPTQVVYETTHTYGASTTLEERYIYNDQQQLVAIKSYKAGSFSQEHTYEYNGNGQVIRENVVSSNGSLLSHTTFEYDAAGKVKISRLYSHDDSEQKAYLIRRYDWSYTSPTQLHTMKVYSGLNDNLSLSYRYEYNYTGALMTKVRVYDYKNTLVNETMLTYDNKHHMLLGLERFRLHQVGEGFPHTQNIIKRESKDGEGLTSISSTYSRETAYNRQGYITHYISSYADGLKRETQITYNCPEE